VKATKSEGDKDATLIGCPSNSAKAFLGRRVPGIRPNQREASEQLFDLADGNAVLLTFLPVAPVPIEAVKFHIAPLSCRGSYMQMPYINNNSRLARLFKLPRSIFPPVYRQPVLS
jgi:hypothetical protein